MVETTLENVTQDEVVGLFGSRDENLRVLREATGATIVSRHGSIGIKGTQEQVEKSLAVIDQMRSHLKRRQGLTAEDVKHFLGVGERPAPGGNDVDADEAPLPHGPAAELAGAMKKVRARTDGQSHYVDAIRKHELTICVGPAGTGKTYLAVAAAIEALRARRIKRIVLVRPAVEAGERLGFLPGDLQAKVHPYLRPLLDALRDMLDYHQVRTYLENDIIEIAPLAYMRGRTLNESFIILDEGQNTTIPQMQMFLTRMGEGSKIVVTGDLSQVDLPGGAPNGLEDCVHRLAAIEGVAIVRMRKSDIVRHRLVQAIVKAYEIGRPADSR